MKKRLRCQEKEVIEKPFFIRRRAQGSSGLYERGREEVRSREHEASFSRRAGAIGRQAEKDAVDVLSVDVQVPVFLVRFGIKKLLAVLSENAVVAVGVPSTVGFIKAREKEAHLDITKHGLATSQNDFAEHKGLVALRVT